ncbi:hypothetical protein GCM10028777_00770 [Angustibacter speluncae]
MTFAMTVHGRRSIWVVADQLLSRDGRPVMETASKIVQLETVDGKGFLAYAGLGITKAGMQPSKWMNDTLRGVPGLTFEDSMGRLYDVAQQQLRPILQHMPGHRHDVVGIAHLKDGSRRTLSMTLLWNPSNGQHHQQFLRHTIHDVTPAAPMPITVIGSGARVVSADRGWMGPLRSAIRARDAGRISDFAVADMLARVNLLANDGEPTTVGTNSIVCWKDTVHGGGNFQFYDHDARSHPNAYLPTLDRGLDLSALGGVLESFMGPHLMALLNDEAAPEIDTTAVDEALGRLPRHPDDRLR